MPNPNVFRAAGALGARRRWQPGSSEEELLADLQAAKDDDLIDKVAERAPKMLPAQAGRLRRLVNSPMFPVVLIPNPARERASDRPPQA